MTCVYALCIDCGYGSKDGSSKMQVQTPAPPFNVLYKSSRDGGAPRERIRKRATDMRHQQSFS